MKNKMLKEPIKIYLCMDCGMPIYRTTALYRFGRCRECYKKERCILPKVYLCKHCALPISYNSVFQGGSLCRSCGAKLKWQKKIKKVYLCSVCALPISYHGAFFDSSMCRSCSTKECIEQGKIFTPEAREKLHKANVGKNNPMYGVRLYGKDNPNWRNGVSFELYPLGWNNTFKEQIRFRDGYKCVVCGCPEVENGRKLDVHHEDYDKNNLSPENLSSLCQSCHGKTNGNRKFWIAFLSKLRSNV